LVKSADCHKSLLGFLVTKILPQKNQKLKIKIKIKIKTKAKAKCVIRCWAIKIIKRKRMIVLVIFKSQEL
jgi:hypothetical protein